MPTFHGNLDLTGRVFLDLGDVGQQQLRRRSGLSAVHVQRVDDVVGIKCLARCEDDILAEIEDPLGCARPDLPVLEQFTLEWAKV